MVGERVWVVGIWSGEERGAEREEGWLDSSRYIGDLFWSLY